MGSVVEWPERPHFSTLKFQHGEEVKINVFITPESSRDNILFKCGEQLDGDIALFISFDVQYQTVTITSKNDSGWGKIIKCYGVPLETSSFMQILIYCSLTHYQIYVSSKLICEYPQSISCTRISHLAICGDFLVERIKYISRPSPGLFPVKPKKVEKTCYGTIVIPVGVEEPEKLEKLLLLHPTVAPFLPVASVQDVESVTETKIVPYSTTVKIFICVGFTIGVFSMLALYMVCAGHALIDA